MRMHRALNKSPHHHCHTEPEQNGVGNAGWELQQHCLLVRFPQHDQKVARETQHIDKEWGPSNH
jgi:hypothetical protein